MSPPLAPSLQSDADQQASEVRSGERFEFGENWRRFLSVLDDERIAEAERSLRDMLGTHDLRGRRFLDVGSGSGLFSLAARRLEADRVHSFDFDPSSVGCTAELRRRFFPGDDRWVVERGSALDGAYLSSLGTWDIVYSWGVLHHTGDMWRALALVEPAVAPGGRLFISIYNDQGRRSRIWRRLKQGYNAVPAWLRLPYAIAVMGPLEVISFALYLRHGHPREYIRSWTEYKRRRGMSRWHDIIDWVGGYPYEVATPDAITAFFAARGFDLERIVRRDGIGCNEFVLTRTPRPSGTPH